MIKKLRRKFILINLALVGLVLLVVFSILVGSNAQRLTGQSFTAMRMALQWQDGDGPPRFEIARPHMDGEPKNAKQEPQFSIVPVFTVTIQDGVMTQVNDGGQVDVSEEVAAQAAEEVLSTGNQEGTLSSLRLRYMQETAPDGTVRIAFADQSWERESLLSLVATSLIVWLLALVGFFFISLFLSSLALRPAETAWRQQRQFVADASHELKTPLTVILANTGIVLSHRDDKVAQQAKWVEYIQEEAGQMKGLVDDLLFLAKSDDGRLIPHLQSVDMSDLAMGCLLPFESVAFEAGVALESEVAPNLLLTGDEGQLRRLILILLDNAVKYAGAGGRATLTLSRQQERLHLSVHNTGVPIPPEHLPHLFERFYRVDSARDRAQGGYGLGLAIAKSIADSHSGKISVTSTLEGGTTFAVLFAKEREK